MKVSVLMLAYNHERHIAQALDSAVGQQAPFDFEIVVGEDASTDATPRIVADYQRRFPALVRPLFHHANLGMHDNFLHAFSACRGEYVALLEGDDYWTEPSKLRRQVELMDRQPLVAVCGHRVRVLDESEPERIELFPADNGRRTFSLEDILVANFLPTCSTMFRRAQFTGFPPWVRGLRALDWPLHVLNARFGSIALMPEVMGVYRRHAGGAWTGLPASRRCRYLLDMYEAFDTFFAGKYEKRLRPPIAHARFEHAWALAQEGRRREALCEWARLAASPRAWPYLSRLKSAALLLCVLSPESFAAAHRLYRSWRQGRLPGGTI